MGRPFARPKAASCFGKPRPNQKLTLRGQPPWDMPMGNVLWRDHIPARGCSKQRDVAQLVRITGWKKIEIFPRDVVHFFR